MRSRPTRTCRCGVAEKSKGQQLCKACHAQDMKERRRLATARGTYTIKGVKVLPRETSRDTKGEK